MRKQTPSSCKCIHSDINHQTFLFEKKRQELQEGNREKKKVARGDTHRGGWVGGGGGGGGSEGERDKQSQKVKKDGDDTCRHTNNRGKMGKEGRQAEKEMGQRQGVCVGGFN